MSTTGQTARPSTSNNSKPPFLESFKVLKSKKGVEPDNNLEEFEEGFDLYFSCSDGIVSTHRLIISNVSKYIMSMMDDQPPWYPTTIHVMDFPRSIIQILVDLAYTGEMRFPEDLQSDVFDAMQTLGWIHTDCLSAAFYDPEHPEHISYEKDLSAVGKSPKINSRIPSAAPKTPQSPLNDKVDTFERLSYSDVGDESMEISNLPEISLSEDEDSSSATNLASKSMRKVFTGAFDGEKTLSLQNDIKTSIKEGKDRISIDKATDENVQPQNHQLEDEAPNPKSPGRRSSRRPSRRISISESNVEPENEIRHPGMSTPQKTTARKDSKDEIVEKGTDKKSRKSTAQLPTVPETSNGPTELPIVDDYSQMSSASETSSLNGSPSKRQRRKPKRFDEEDEEVPEKAKLSSPVKIKGKKGRKKKEIVSPLEVIKLPEPVDSDPTISTCSMSNDNKGKQGSGATSKKGEDRSIKTASKKTPKKKNPAKIPETLQPEKDGDSFSLLDEVSKSEEAKTTKTPQKISVTKKKLSGEGPRSSLITAYFNKAVPAKTEDALEVSEVQDKSSSEVVDLITDSGAEADTKRQKKKRTFDQISEAAATPAAEDQSVTGAPGAAKVGRPVRKSMRARNPSKNQTESSAEDVPTPTVQGQSPKRKRTKKQDKVEVIEDTIPLQSPQPPTETPTRRSSKK